MGDAFSVAARTLCRECADQFFKERGQTRVQPGEVTRLVDPTVCAQCAKDCGEQELPRIANLPVCENCDHLLRHRPFPTWLKASFTVFLCVAVAAFVYNMRYFLAYVDIVRANHAMDSGRFEQGVRFFSAAADRVPDLPELAIFKAQQLAKDDRFDEAMAVIEKSKPKASPPLRAAFQQVELGVQTGQAFHRHDYDAFLNASQQLMKIRPQDPNAIAAVASAYACKYATTGDEKFREEARRYLTQAREHAGDANHELDEYENRIFHRLATRDIISQAQFRERFPNGWKPEDGK
jgi:tetratricopeptide (TPR) repeat protein